LIAIEIFIAVQRLASRIGYIRNADYPIAEETFSVLLNLVTIGAKRDFTIVVWYLR
jgi:hypothetical protein